MKISLNICFLELRKNFVGTQNEFELAMVNEPSVFELLRFYYIELYRLNTILLLSTPFVNRYCLYCHLRRNLRKHTFWPVRLPKTQISLCICRPRWLSWMRRQTGDQEVAGSTPVEVGNILSWRLIMKYFLRSSADSRRAVVSFWRKNVHNTG